MVSLSLMWVLLPQNHALLTSDRIAFIYFKVLLIFLFSFLPVLVVPFVKFLPYSTTNAFVSLHCPVVLSVFTLPSFAFLMALLRVLLYIHLFGF